MIFGEYFVFFDEGKLVILLNGFIKKTQKTPKIELNRAVNLKEKYFIEKNNNHENKKLERNKR